MNLHSQKIFSHISVIIIVMFACCAVFVLTSCSKKPSTAIIGKWLYPGEVGTIEFRKDGTVTLFQNTGPLAGHNMEGTYTFTDENQMTLRMKPVGDNNPRMMQTVNFIVRIHDDSMDWAMIQGQTHLARQK